MPDPQLQSRFVSEVICLQLISYVDNLPSFHRHHAVMDCAKPDGIKLIWPNAH